MEIRTVRKIVLEMDPAEAHLLLDVLNEPKEVLNRELAERQEEFANKLATWLSDALR